MGLGVLKPHAEGMHGSICGPTKWGVCAAIARPERFFLVMSPLAMLGFKPVKRVRKVRCCCFLNVT